MSLGTQAWRLVARILFEPSSDAANAALARALPRTADFWERAISIVNENLVTATLWQRLSSRQLADCVSADAREYLDAYADLSRDETSERRAQTIECIAALNAAGITPLPIKGASLLLDPESRAAPHRFMTDIDLLVPPERVDAALRVLDTLGYEPTPDPEDEYADHHHLVPYGRRGQPTTIELHRAAVPATLEPALPVHEIWERSTERAQSGIRFRAAAPTDALMIHFLHAAIVDRYLATLQIPLRTLLDIGELIERSGEEIDWPLVAQRAARIGAAAALRRFCHLHLRVTGRPLCNDPPPTYADAIHVAIAERLVTRPGWIQWAHRLDRLSAHELRRRHKDAGTGSVHAQRLRELGAMLVSGAKRLGRDRSPF